MARASHSLTGLSHTSAGWWTLGLGVLAVLVGPIWGFGFVGLLVAIGTFGVGAAAYRHGERSWPTWLGVALAVGVICYLPFMSTTYPYTNQ